MAVPSKQPGRTLRKRRRRVKPLRVRGSVQYAVRKSHYRGTLSMLRTANAGRVLVYQAIVD